jgi:hypothetical protein
VLDALIDGARLFILNFDIRGINNTFRVQAVIHMDPNMLKFI